MRRSTGDGDTFCARLGGHLLTLSSHTHGIVCARVSGGGSHLTTGELQQQFREMKNSDTRPKLLFHVSDAQRDGRRAGCAHVEVALLSTGTFSPRHVTVGRSYADFSRFHRRLKTEFGEELEGVEPPGPRLCGRGLAPQEYLSRAFAVCGHSPLFAQFLTERERAGAAALMRAGRYADALEHLGSVLAVHEKLLPWQRQTSTTAAVPALAAAAVCHRDLGRPREALAAARRALPPVRRYGMRRYRAPLLRLLVDWEHGAGRPAARLQEELTAAEDGRPASARSLKEVALEDLAD
ncbi:sorting nexin-20 isoform X1 [Phycodurus eques]|uniref:sorting nexin-20 isoform X1 n=1 Tax=Phycodurus eques TaxID=693459 RepID=UPI002ACDDC3F|nr:sorting nexin-20 isoform X1 [Phycodurus eques]